MGRARISCMVRKRSVTGNGFLSPGSPPVMPLQRRLSEKRARIGASALFQPRATLPRNLTSNHNCHRTFTTTTPDRSSGVCLAAGSEAKNGFHCASSAASLCACLARGSPTALVDLARREPCLNASFRPLFHTCLQNFSVSE